MNYIMKAAVLIKNNCPLEIISFNVPNKQADDHMTRTPKKVMLLISYIFINTLYKKRIKDHRQ